MKIEEIKNIIQEIMFSKVECGLTVFACIKDEEKIVLKKFLINNTLRDELKGMIKDIVEKQFVSDSFELDIIDNIADNRKVFYEIPQGENFYPFASIDNYQEVHDFYSEEEQDSLKGLLFRVNLNDNDIWLYQHIYPVRMIKRSKAIYAMFSGDTYVPLNRDILQIDSRIDFLIIDNAIITSNINLLQKYFGFDEYIRSEAKKAIDIIDELDIVSDMSKVFAFESKEQLTNAKKLLKAKNSPVLKMEKKELISKLIKHPRYKEKFHFENDKIVINSQKEVNEFIKMLNDDIVRSELTNSEYDSSNKQILPPLQN